MDFLDIISKLLGIMALIIGSIYIPYNNHVQKKRDEENKKAQEKRDIEIDKKQEIRLKLIAERIEELESSVVNMSASLELHLNDDLFLKEFEELIKSTSMNIIESQYMLAQGYKNILSYWADRIKKFGITFYRSNKRKLEMWERDKTLTEEKTILIDDFSKYIDSNIENIKIFKGNKIKMSEFLYSSNIYASFEILVMDLIKNGLSEKDIKNKFKVHIEKFYRIFITSTIVWDSLEKQNYKKDVA